ncbi:FAD-containing oxidoreductase [Bordetella genomosp. 13]|uniref:Mercuric reductase n=1 Tax=Bordetella genomosp. 13 TaxID=463040 RepID=A0A1W6ZFE1_9BORD|nr:FAD-containing oxidoreductase [Bordetella genomosp. 13]ARP95982.1 mercuric reductase [Bordetella genomosp. 13]
MNGSDQSSRATASQAYDAIIIGTGQASPALAGRLAQAGMKVAVIERKLVGGTCVNVGCTPTKAMVASAYVARQAARAAEYGLELPVPPRVDLRAVCRRVHQIVQNSRSGLEEWLQGMENCTLIRGHARFEGPRQVRVDDRLLSADRIFINVGARAVVPDSLAAKDLPCLTSSDMLSLHEVPRHLVVIGGSYVGLEFAQIYRRFGAAVTVIERGSRLVGREDAEVSDQIRSILEAEGIVVELDARDMQLLPHADGVAVRVGAADGLSREISGSHVLVATGRRPNTDDLSLDRAGIATDKVGYITVDDELRTNVEGVWALGDCNGRGAFTHTSYNDFEIVAANLLDGASRSLRDRIPAYALYIDPPLGRVGMTVAQARAAGCRVRVGVRPMTRVARAIEKGETQGSMRIVVDAETEEILGAAILGPGGDEAVHQVLAAMAAGGSYRRLQQTMAIHPTVSELVPTLLGELSDPE